MGDEAEKMEALKRTYAEIILNASKEAAARVMASENKARRFQQDLVSTKDEAARMLLRSKQMIDAKTNEAEVASSNQQRKIDELEAQLNEAEDLILDLREELSQAKEQLHKARKRNLYHSIPNGESSFSPDRDRMAENDLTGSDLYGSSVEYQPKIVSHEAKRLFADLRSCSSERQATMSTSGFDNYPVDNALLASMITDSRKPELCSNGCMERIPATETTSVFSKLSTGDELHSCSRDELEDKLNLQDIGFCRIPCLDDAKLHASGNSRIVEKSGRNNVLITSNDTKAQTINDCRTRRKRSIYGKAKHKSCKQRFLQRVRRHQKRLAVSHHRSNSHKDCNSIDFGDALARSEDVDIVESGPGKEVKEQLNKSQPVSVIRRSFRKRTVKYWDDVVGSFRTCPSHQFKRSHQTSSPLSLHRSKPVDFNANPKADKLKIEDQTKMETCTNTNGVYGHTETESLPEEDRELVDISVKQDDQTAELKLNSVLHVDCHVQDSTALDEFNESITQADSKNLFKYAFSRKRKKESLSNLDEGSSSGRSYQRKRSNYPGRQHSKLRDRPSRNSSAVQVALQLISLSGDKCL